MISPKNEKMLFKTSTKDDLFSGSRDSLVLMSKVLCCLGLGQRMHESDTGITPSFAKCSRILYPVLLHLSILDCIIMCSIEGKLQPDYLKENIAFVVGCLICLSLFHSVRARRELMHNLTQRVQKVSSSQVPAYAVIRSLVLMSVILTGLYTFLVAYVTITQEDVGGCEYFYYYVIDECGSSIYSYIYISVKSYLMCFINPLVCYMSSIMYCSLCRRCTTSLIRCRREAERIIKTESFSELKPSFYQKYSEICEVIQELQDIFSLPSFLIFVSNFLDAFIVLTSILKGSDYGLLYKMDNTFVAMPASVLAILIPACASQVAKEMKKNKEIFSRLHDKVIFHSDGRNDAQKVAKSLKQKEPITLSAWGMIEFSSNIVPTVIGCFLTYGLLILNIDKQ